MNAVPRDVHIIAALLDPVLEESSSSCVDKLAQLFPTSSPVRTTARIVTKNGGRCRLQEQTVVEFVTAHEVLFSSNLPLEFEDRVHLVNSDCSLDVDAMVVAALHHGGQKAVAVRFVDEVENWIIKP